MVLSPCRCDVGLRHGHRHADRWCPRGKSISNYSVALFSSLFFLIWSKIWIWHWVSALRFPTKPRPESNIQTFQPAFVFAGPGRWASVGAHHGIQLQIEKSKWRNIWVHHAFASSTPRTHNLWCWGPNRTTTQTHSTTKLIHISFMIPFFLGHSRDH